MAEFFILAMSYSLVKRRLNSLSVHPNFWDADGASFRGVEMWYRDDSHETYGDIVDEGLKTRTLTQADHLCKIRGMRYEFGQEYGWDEVECDGPLNQWYRQKDCYNKFQADVECNGITVPWKMGDVFHEPNVVIPTIKSRVFSRFIGWKTDNYDAEIAGCDFVSEYVIWVTPKGKDHLLDNLIAVYRMDTSDYSGLDTEESP
eukprot:Gregarina_sp_Pseudo_9__1499@NODE_2008_length_1205_cov_734_369640_g1854_i0_p1_GENE_NODE_2008_length_1205_cov_734_369640_g1854_i0NODE_2008_length_1205_cov_734_369640_g1854_i0_p1_ORF_typecomplete_len202_score27_34_NODE_2008_length_1205_cov_734_369640_g1854_i0127732